MNVKEARRVYVMQQVAAGGLTVRQAAGLLNLSERQVKRLKKGMKKKGEAALVHGNRGRTPKHAIHQDTRELVVSLGKGLYKDASAEHFSEMLAVNEKVCISGKSVTRILRQEGVLDPTAKHHRRCRKSRDRMPKEGQMVQADASPHEWLEERGPKLSLHGAIDDATGKVLGLYFRPTEDLKGYLEMLRQVITRHGVPRALYTDGHSIFFSPAKDKLTIEEELAGKQVALTQFGRALDELGVLPVHARSPQAKGRVERLWGTLQSRLVVELRVAGIITMEEANRFLPGFIDRFNARFAVEAADPEPAYIQAPQLTTLETILCVKKSRTASNGSTISYGNQLYKLVDGKGGIQALTPSAKVEVLLHLDDSTDALYEGKRYQLQLFAPPKPTPKPQRDAGAKRVGQKPSPDNPWVKFKLPKPNRDPVESYFRRHQEEHAEPGSVL